MHAVILLASCSQVHLQLAEANASKLHRWSFLSRVCYVLLGTGGSRGFELLRSQIRGHFS